MGSIKNPSIFFPFYFFVPTFTLIISKYTFESTAKLIYLGKNLNVLIMLILQFSQNCLIAIVHYWLRCILLKLGWPTFYLNVLMIVLYMEIIGFTLYDFENTRHNMQMVLPSTYVAYLGRFGMEQKVFHEFWSNIKGAVAHSNSVSNIIKTTILDSPQFWILIIVVMIIFFLFGLYLIYSNWNEIFESIFPNQHADLQENSSSFFISIDNELKTYKINFFNIFLVFIHFLAFVDLIVNLSIKNSNEDFKARYFSILPYFSSLQLALTHFEKKPSKQTLEKVNQITRNFLPPGRYWIDTRDNPIYPEVHGDFESFCAYNPTSNECKKKEKKEIKKEEILKPEELPNVLLLLYESFNPATYLINKAFLEEHVKNPNMLKTDTPFYNEEIMPFLHKFAKEEMITFSGMQTLGLPSFSGLHSILTQEPPSQTYMNIINGWQNDVDDIPSYFHMKGYRTLIVNANRFDFDGKQYWIYKKSKQEEARYRMNCLSSYGDSFNDSLQMQIGDYSFVNNMKKKCTEEEVEKYLKKHKDIYDFPRFFDYAAAYYPTAKQAKAIQIDPNTVYENPSISVSGDRIVAKEIEAHWKQQKSIMKEKSYKMPLFTLASSVDGHMPYSGYDKPEFYSKIDPNIKPHSEEMRVARFLNVNRYTDEYFIKELIEWLKVNDPNTILLFTGDHGTRDIPAKEKNQQFTKNIKYDPKCIHESTGSDSFYYVSGGIAYLGKDERIKKAFGFDKLAGKTIKFTVDHGDMIYTAEEIIQRLQGKSLMPTNRKSRNLVDMSLDLINETNEESFAKKIDESGWKSVSMVSHMVEYHNGMKMVRFHPGDINGAHIYKQCIYPTGLLPTNFIEGKDKRNFVVIREEKNETEKKKHLEFVDEALQYLAAENYLGAKNRLYNYKFRDEDCIKNHNCQLPKKLPDIKFKDGPFLKFILNIYIGGALGMMLPFIVIVLIKSSLNLIKSDEKKDFTSLLENTSVTDL